MKTNILKLILSGALAFGSTIGVLAAAPSGLDARTFAKYWHVESESPDYRLQFNGDTAEIVAPKGLTLWRNEPMKGNTTIEYDACIMTGNPSDRLSDLNCFWMASDPKAASIRSREKWRGGVFLNSYSLQLYYLGFGGNSNTTTRFRRYNGDERGVQQAEYRPSILTEYTDPAHLLKPGKWYHIKIENRNGRVRYYIDGERLVDYLDPQPLTSGHFGFRTTASRARITNFKYECTDAQPNQVPVHCVGAAPSRASGASFGVPFDRGAVTDRTPISVNCGNRTLATDTWPMAWWPDGSVKWLGVATTIPARAESLSVSIGGKSNAQPKQQNLAAVKGGQIVVTTGVSTAYVPVGGNAIVDSLYRGSVKVAQNGHLSCATTSESYETKVDNATIERNGANHAVVKVSGSLRAATGREWLPFTVRLYFYRNVPEVKLVHTFVYDGDQNADFIKSLGISFDVPMREVAYNRHVAFACPDSGVWSEPVQPLVGRRVLKLPGDTASTTIQHRQMQGKLIPSYDKFDAAGKRLIDNWAQWDGYRLSQVGPDGFTIRKRATADSPWIGTTGGTRAPGYAFVGDVSGGLGVMYRDFWQSYPSTIEVSNARSNVATVTAWLWSPEAEPMDLRHYDKVAHDLEASYEDVQEGLSTPYGIARTTEFVIYPSDGYAGKQEFDRDARHFASASQFMPTPEYLHDRRAFGMWSLPDRTTAGRTAIENRLDSYIDLYKDAIEANRWYGFWNYGDVMHAYDAERHSWKYDVGGYAWDNTELGSNLWLWYMFLRTGRADIWRMARAMGRHVAEVDVYHIGDNAGLGSRHNVSHWGCGAKEARISQAAFNRFMYYLTTDERSADLMTDVKDNDHKLYTLDPMRLAEPRDKYPCTAPARLRIGPDWLAYAGNWMTEWERTGNTAYRDKIVAGMKSICALPGRLFAGPLALGYDPATGVITSECDSTLRSTNHLMTIMGGFEVMNELMPLIPDPAWQDAWLDLATNYKATAWKLRRNRFRVSRLAAYSAWQRNDKEAAAKAWYDLLTTNEHTDAPPFEVHEVKTPLVPQRLLEGYPISTNETAMWSLDAIYMQEVIPMAE